MQGDAVRPMLQGANAQPAGTTVRKFHVPANRPDLAAMMILDEFWDKLLPVDPIKISARLGLEVRPKDPLSEEEWSGRFSATDRLIEYSSREASVRQRFTIAHELGHFVLSHGDAFRDTPAAFSSRNSDPRERDANRFAAELLMPEAAIRKVIAAGRFDEDELARAFGVSKVAMAYRVGNLGLESFF